MRTYDVYHHPRLGCRAVKRGFSWPAFFFGMFWALSRKLWWVAFLILMLYCCVALVENAFGHTLVYAYLLIWVFAGLVGNIWKRNRLMKKGFRQLPHARAGTADLAIAMAVKTQEVRSTAYTESARVTLVKRDGTTVENLRGGVGWRDDGTPEISILGLGDKPDTHISLPTIAPGDRITRRMADGTEEAYEVIHPVFEKGSGSYAAGYDIEARKL